MLAELCREQHRQSLSPAIDNRGYRAMATHPIVLIDDDTNSAEAMAELLRDEGYDVLTAETGKGGMELLGRTDPALVILDIHLPDVDGLAVLRDFRCRSKHVPVLMVSAEDQAGVMAEALAAGASSFLHKPISSTMLLSAVRHLTRHEC